MVSKGVGFNLEPGRALTFWPLLGAESKAFWAEAEVGFSNCSRADGSEAWEVKTGIVVVIDVVVVVMILRIIVVRIIVVIILMSSRQSSQSKKSPSRS